MSNLAYLAVLLFIIAGSGWLEFALRTRVYRRPVRTLLAILPGLVLFMIWDAYAIASGHWTFDSTHTTGIIVIAGVPLEELLFFVVVPLAAILTFEAVRSVRGWPAGDEK